MKLELTQKLQQQQILAPQMILSMDILLLTAQDLQQRIEKEFAENPALEVHDPNVQESKFDVPSTPEPKDESGFERIDSFRLTGEGPGSLYSNRSTISGGDDKLQALQNTQGRPPGLREHLTEQLRLLTLPERVREVGLELIQNLDHRGYLLSSAVELYESIQDQCSLDDFQSALTTIRSLDPPGIGAENLQECLLLQLERDAQEYPLETQLIVNHLADLRDNKIPKIAKDLKTSIDEIRDALEIIRQLDPHPGSQFDSEPTVYVKPDVFVEVSDGKIHVRIESGSLPQLSISESCRDLLQESRRDRELGKFVRGKIESAQWLIQAIKQRQNTLYDIAVAMVDYQREFFLKSPECIRALKMQTIADAVGVHISTVSRAIKNKYMQTPWGLFELRYFFTGGVGNANGEVESRRIIYRRIAQIIENEEKTKPLSDAAIAEVLQKEGLNIARRTVTKYREQEGIPSSRQRKNHWAKA